MVFVFVCFKKSISWLDAFVSRLTQSWCLASSLNLSLNSCSFVKSKDIAVTYFMYNWCKYFAFKFQERWRWPITATVEQFKNNFLISHQHCLSFFDVTSWRILQLIPINSMAMLSQTCGDSVSDSSLFSIFLLLSFVSLDCCMRRKSIGKLIQAPYCKKL